MENLHVFQEKVQKTWKNEFLEKFLILNEFPESKINEKHRKTSKPKSGKFARFSRKFVYVFQGKKKWWIYKFVMKLGS